MFVSDKRVYRLVLFFLFATKLRNKDAWKAQVLFNIFFLSNELGFMDLSEVGWGVFVHLHIIECGYTQLYMSSMLVYNTSVL